MKHGIKSENWRMKKGRKHPIKTAKKNEDSLWSLWDNFKHGNIYIMGVLEGEETEIMELTIYLKNKQRFHSYFCSPFFPNLLPNITHCPPYVLLSVCKDEASGSQEQILSDGLVPFSSTLTTNRLPLFQQSHRFKALTAEYPCLKAFSYFQMLSGQT